MKKEISFFGSQLKKIMFEKSFTQQKLADELGIAQEMISRWINGVRNPSFNSIKKIAAVLDVPADCFIEKPITTAENNTANKNNIDLMDKKDIKLLLHEKDIEILQLKNKILSMENEFLKRRKSED